MHLPVMRKLTSGNGRAFFDKTRQKILNYMKWIYPYKAILFVDVNNKKMFK